MRLGLKVLHSHVSSALLKEKGVKKENKEREIYCKLLKDETSLSHRFFVLKKKLYQASYIITEREWWRWWRRNVFLFSSLFCEIKRKRASVEVMNNLIMNERKREREKSFSNYKKNLFMLIAASAQFFVFFLALLLMRNERWEWEEIEMYLS